jgi:hypothetical protein
MMNCRISVVPLTLAALVAMATAQNPKAATSSTTSASDPIKTAIKPLTPKTEGSTHHSTSAPPAGRSANNQKTNAELIRLERQSAKASAPQTANTGAAKNHGPKPAGAPPSSGSGINASYQKPHIPQQKN